MKIGRYVFLGSTSHWTRNATRHGAISNPRFFAARMVRLGVRAPSRGLRLWLYFRGGYALSAEVYRDGSPL